LKEGSLVDRWLSEADDLRRQGRLTEARDRIRKALAVAPSDAHANLRLGIVLVQAGQRPLAISHLRKSLQTAPDSYEALAWLSSSLCAVGELEEAELLARKAADLNPNDPAVQDNLARIYLSMRQPEKAREALEKAVDLGPGIAPLHCRLGQTYQILGRPTEACACYQRTLDISPGDHTTRDTLVRLLMSLGDSSGAIKLLRQATRLNPSSPEPFIQLAKALFEIEAGAEALEPLHRALELNPNLALAQGMLGACLSELGRFPEAIAHFERALALDPTMGIVYYDLVESKTISEGDAELMRQMDVQLSRRNLLPPDRMALHFASGKAFDDLGRYREAFGGVPFDRSAYAAKTDAMIRRFPNARSMSIPDKNPSEIPVLIVGMIRSGTTLVERILSSHLEVAAGGEIKFLAAQYDEDMYLGLDTPGKAGILAHQYLAILRDLAGGKRRVTDKMPSNFRALGPIHALFPHARIVHCRRHPVDTCLSIYGHLFHQPPGFAYDREALVFGYREYQKLMDHWREVLPPGRFFEIDYEELGADREPIIRRLLEFCDLPWDPQCLRHEETGGQIRTVSKRQARQPIYRSSVQRWKNYEPWLGPLGDLLSSNEPS
jgi:tetratricopeptide (TPR) repeat protein